MDQPELFAKLQQIEDHARDALASFPELATERLRMILALAKYIRAGLERGPQASRAPVLTGNLGAVAVNDAGKALDSA